MAKRIRRSAGDCSECGREHDYVLIIPSSDRKPLRLFHARHDRLGGGRCPKSDRPVPMAYWPGWAKDELGKG